MTPLKERLQKWTFLTSYCKRRNQSMHFQSWKCCILDSSRKRYTSHCGVLVLAMAMEIAKKEIIFHSLTTIDLRYWIASQYLSHNFLRSILKRIKTQVKRIAMALRFKIDTSKYVYNVRDLFQKKRKQNFQKWRFGR